MKGIVGFLLIIFAIIFGFYVGGYLCFFKGIVQVIDQIRAPVMETTELVWGICKVIFASAVGVFGALVPGAIGLLMMDD